MSMALELAISIVQDGAQKPLPAAAVAAPTDSLLLRYSNDREGEVHLLHLVDDKVTVFFSVHARAGMGYYVQNNEVKGYTLDGLKGRQRFGVAWTPKSWPGAVPPPALRTFLSAPDREGRLHFDDPAFGRIFVELITVWVEGPLP